MAHSVETRVPFLDKDFIDLAMSIHPSIAMRNRIEKWVLRKAFEDYLPESIAWRQKEQFSDGVGYGWIDSLKNASERQVSDEQLRVAEQRFPHNTPTTKEAYWYREMFEKHFPPKNSDFSVEKTVEKWIPVWSANTDPSGRVQRVHLSPIE